MKDREVELAFIRRYKAKSIERIKKSASKFVLVKRFSLKHRAGLKQAREEGLVTIIDTMFGRAYKMEESA
jgi:hypothetical protein